MGSPWGNALKIFGEAVPKAAALYDQNSIDKKKREQDEREALARLALISQQTDAAKIATDTARTNQGLGNDARVAANDYSATMRDSESQRRAFDTLMQLDKSKMVESPAVGESSQLPIGQYDRVNDLDNFSKKTGLEQMGQFRLPQMAGYDEGVKYMVDLEKTKAENAQKAADRESLRTIADDANMARIKEAAGLRSDENRIKAEERAAIEAEKQRAKKEAADGKKKLELQPKIDLKNQLVDLIDSVKNHPAKFSGVSLGHITQLGSTDARDYSKKLNQLKSMLTLENLKYLKGATSNKDITFVNQASSSLDKWGSTKNLDAELDKIRNNVSSISFGEDESDPLGIFK